VLVGAPPFWLVVAVAVAVFSKVAIVLDDTIAWLVKEAGREMRASKRGSIKT